MCESGWKSCTGAIFGSCLVLFNTLITRPRGPLPCDLDVIVRWFGHKELPGYLHLSRLRREVAEEATLLLDEEELRQLLGLGLQDLDPLLQLGDQVVELHRARHAEVKVWEEERQVIVTKRIY